MMKSPEIRNRVQRALAEAPGAPRFSDAAERLLNALGYESDLTPPDQPEDPAFWLSRTSDTQAKRDFLASAAAMRVVFQITDGEISRSAQMSLLDAPKGFQDGNARSFLFAAVDLNGARYPRGRCAAFTREINKAFPMPCAVLFRASDGRLTFAFVHRRANRRDADRDVIGSVSLVREIVPDNPHRAHLDILAELSLDERLKWMQSRGKAENFDGLLEAWLAALDTEELNKQFYKDLFAWFQRAVQEARFPTGESVSLEPEEHVIRLITRLLFVWFVKEKGLVDEGLFIEERVAPLLRDYDRARGDSYYRAVLQNLFFATLNTEIAKRGFSAESNATHRDFSKRRYRDQMNDPDALAKMFARTPFINGGLFDCLDSFDGQGRGGCRVDCFSDYLPHQRKLSVPNRLFFDKDGLIPLFERYKFTVEENTPTETEVALDPELLGKAFENLLAANTPETRDSARKRTGSYYTPRPVVDYMVDEALSAALARKISPAAENPESARERLRRLFDYEDAFEDDPFSQDERRAAVRAVSRLRVLDPAVGSGAFPMGVLHKLTLALRRLDPDNALWQDEQKSRAQNRASAAFETDDQAERDAELQEISDTFERYRDSDFGRKLYLIQNSVFGVDIQQIAAQIAKLRFFISLAIEQEANGDQSDNYGIKPLPNLETRFVAANTLVNLESNVQMSLGQTDAVTRIQRELDDNRERHFHATARNRKRECRENDRRLRQELARELRRADFSAADAQKIAAWDPYDQNSTSDWFDPEYMFGVADGFDVVIGNPPYINVENMTDAMRSYLFANYQFCEKRTDIYIGFMEKSLSALSANGVMCFIVPASFTKQQYAEKMRQNLISNHAIIEIADASSYRIFENAVVFNAVLTVGKTKNDMPTRIRLFNSNADFERLSGAAFSVDQNFFASLKDSRFDSNPNIASLVSIKEKAWTNSVRLDQICLVAYGARLNHKSKKIGKAHYIAGSRVAGAKRFLEGRNIERYSFSQDGWLEYTPSEHYNPMFPELFDNDKLMSINVVKDRLRFAYDSGQFYNSHTVVNIVRLDLLTGASHRTATNAVKRADLALAGSFDYKFLLAILNSEFINWYFVNFLSEKLHFYPNDAKGLPIPKIPAAAQRPFIELVERILTAKDANPSADTSALESEIDALVYALYGLTADESAAVERG